MKSRNILFIGLMMGLLLSCKSREELAQEAFQLQTARAEQLVSSYPAIASCFGEFVKTMDQAFQEQYAVEGEELRVEAMMMILGEYEDILNMIDSASLWRDQFLHQKTTLETQVDMPFADYDRLQKEKEQMDLAWRKLTNVGLSQAGSCREGFKSLRKQMTQPRARLNKIAAKYGL